MCVAVVSESHGVPILFCALEGLDEYSHVWALFLFHWNPQLEFKAKIKPLRMHGSKVSVLSPQSLHRGNDVGSSVVPVPLRLMIIIVVVVQLAPPAIFQRRSASRISINCPRRGGRPIPP